MKVYFNNSCNICKAEINLYKKENIQDLNWIDITKNKNDAKTEKEITNLNESQSQRQSAARGRTGKVKS